MTSPRVTVAMRKAAREQILDTPITTFDDLVERVCSAVISADDVKARYAVATQDPHGNTLVYGPYATQEAAEKAIETGACAHIAGTRAMALPLIPSPRTPRRKK